jgi:hypothetical protein
MLGKNRVPRCQAKKHGSPPKQCGHPAEQGKRVCKWHGARGGRPKNPQNPFVYFSAAVGGLREMLVAAQAMSKEQLESSDDEVRLLTSCISFFLKEKGEDLSAKDMGKLSWMISSLGSLKSENTNTKYAGKNVVSIKAIYLMFEWFTMEMVELLKDTPDKLSKFIEKMRAFHLDISKLLEKRTG